MRSTIIAACSLLCLLACHALHAQDVFTYGPMRVGKAEFLRAFLKNNNRQHPGSKELREYLQLYIRYKLKVKAAYDLRLDTLPGQITELNDFRKQLSEAYLYDEASLKILADEAFNRSLKDIHLAHVFIPFQPAGEYTDTAKAYRLAMNAWRELQQGTGFGTVATRYSADASVTANKGDIGYITAFTLPYVFENLAYATPAGTFSAPYKSRAGYHIFKNTGERKAVGRMKIAQILLAFPPDAGSTAKAAIKTKADSVYNALLKGAPFSNLVQQFSNDNLTTASEGQLQEFGVGQYDAAFERSVFGLPENGAISKPLLTTYGYHIVKRIEHIPVSTNRNNEDAMLLLKRQVMADERMELPRQVMLKKMYRVTGFKKAAVMPPALQSYSDSMLYGKKLPELPATAGNAVVISFPAQQITAGEWLNYLQIIKNDALLTRGKKSSELLEQYSDIMVKNYYVSHLEEFNPEYAAQLQEFKDGNLLFEVMQRSVWDKATADTAGLRKFFNANTGKYTWKPSADAILFTCKDAATARAVKEKLAKNSAGWRNLLAAFNNLQADSGRFELEQLPAPNTTFAAGMITGPAALKDNTGFSFAAIIRMYGHAPRSFEEARGYVLNDYQNHLEEQWLAGLKNKYPVTVNEKVLAELK